MSDSSDGEGDDNHNNPDQVNKGDQFERDLLEEADVPTSMMIDTTAKGVRTFTNDKEASVAALQFSKLKVDEKFLAHQRAIHENMAVDTSQAATAQPSTNFDLTQHVFDLIGSTNEFLR